MNLLSIQDALKNASDQQLIQLMRAPDSTTPSYLVVSELNRRKQMRVKQAEPPSRTVAEDLTSEENMQAPMGIRSLQTPEPGDEDYRPEDEGAGIEAMREGGIVRMQDGGRPRPAAPGDFYGTSMLDLERQGIDEDYERAMSGIETDFRNRQVQSGRAIDDTSQAMADIRSRISSGTAPEQAIAEAMPGYRRADESGIRQLLGLPARQETPAVVAPTEAARPAAPDAMPPAGAAQPSTQRPGGPGGGGGIGAGRPAVPASAAAPDGLPTLQQNMERNLGMFPGIPQELLDRIRDSRTNEGDRRREAQNMALLEAGLRIAGSNNPNFLGAIGEGAAPAAQTYAQQLSQIRQDRRADIQTDMAVAQADLQRRYMAGQISASELQRQTQMLLSNNEIAARERASMRADARAGANAGRNPQLDLIRALQENPQLAETYQRMHGRGPENRIDNQLTAVNGNINAIRQLLTDPAGTLTDAERAEYRAQLTELLQASRSLRSRMQGGLGGSLIPGENGAPSIYQPPGR